MTLGDPDTGLAEDPQVLGVDVERVMGGEVELLLWEEPIGWAITRGTTKGESKFIPMTETDLRQRVSARRAMMNYVLSTERFDLFDGVNLNLNFPSVVGKVSAGGHAGNCNFV